MRRKKIILTNLLAVSMLLPSLLTACGNTNETASSENDSSKSSESSAVVESSAVESSESTEIVFPLSETAEFTALTTTQGEKYLADASAWKKLQEMGNISVELTEVPVAEAKEKAGLILAGGDYPDFMFKQSVVVDCDKYGMEGIYIPLEDLIKEYAPNLTALLDEVGGWNELKAPDGHIYSLPYITESASVSARAWINNEWLNNLGLSMPTNADELYEVLKAFKEQDADGDGDPNNEIPFNFTASDNWYPVRYLLQYVSEGNHYIKMNNADFFAIVDGELVNYAVTDAFREDYLAYLEKLYSEGLIYKDAFVLSNDEQNVMHSSGQIDGVGFAYRNTDYYGKYDIIPPFRENGLSTKSPITKGAMAITDKCENPEILIAWIDYLYTEEGGLLADMGEEGVAYEKTQGGGWTRVEGVDPYDHIIRGYSAFPTLLPDSANAIDAELEPGKAYDAEQKAIAVENSYLMPTLILTEEENERYSELIGDINSYINDYTANVVTGEMDLDETWETYKKTLSDMGIDEVYQILSDAYERAVAQ